MNDEIELVYCMNINFKNKQVQSKYCNYKIKIS